MVRSQALLPSQILHGQAHEADKNLHNLCADVPSVPQKPFSHPPVYPASRLAALSQDSKNHGHIFPALSPRKVHCPHCDTDMLYQCN